MVDCTSNPPRDLMNKYGVKGFPTVLFLDHEGKQVQTLNGRSADAVKQQIEAVAASHTFRLFPEGSLEDAKASAKEANKLIVVAFFAEEDEKLAKKHMALKAGLLMHPKTKELQPRMVWVKRPLEEGEGKERKVTEEAKALKVKKAPTLVVMTAEGKVLKKITSGKKLYKTLAKLADKHSK